jgi:glyoxylase-like metal-dependent hydrolase (beta-lactamase superfamily II)
MRITRLDLGAVLDGPVGPHVPFLGYAIEHAHGLVLFDTGWGGPTDRVPPEWRIVQRSIGEALGEHGYSPLDVVLVVTSHLHQDHYGQNAVFRDVPFALQRRELERARRESPDTREFFDFAGARFELLEGDAEVLPGLHALFTPGHTAGHQSLLLDDGVTRQLLVGDAAYGKDVWDHPERMTPEHPAWPLQVQGSLEEWRSSVDRLRTIAADEVRFCHDPALGAAHGAHA